MYKNKEEYTPVFLNDLYTHICTVEVFKQLEYFIANITEKLYLKIICYDVKIIEMGSFIGYFL